MSTWFGDGMTLVAAALCSLGPLVLFLVLKAWRRAALAGLKNARPELGPGTARLVLRRDAVSERIDLDHVGGPEFSRAVDRSRRASASAGKRALDIVAAILLLALTAPLCLLIAALVRLDSPGPAIYRQRRVGLGGAEFEILKFRSMGVDAEEDGARWAEVNDARVTRFGRFLRATRLDEIPQAVNVLRGEMSFVGPRPERPEFVRLLEKEIPNYHLRHIVRPGITGWAQVKYVYGASVEDARIKLQYDLHYIRNFHLLRDLLIIAMTARVALFGMGGR